MSDLVGAKDLGTKIADRCFDYIEQKILKHEL